MNPQEMALLRGLDLSHRQAVSRFHACEAALRQAGAHRQMRELYASLSEEGRQLARLLDSARGRPQWVPGEALEDIEDLEEPQDTGRR